MIRICGRVRAVKICQWIYINLIQRIPYVKLGDHIETEAELKCGKNSKLINIICGKHAEFYANHCTLKS
jgi:hypothetical protein